MGLYPNGTGSVINFTEMSDPQLAIPTWINSQTYTPSSNESIPTRFQPIPIHIVEESSDSLLVGYSPIVCKNMKQWMVDNKKTDTYKMLLQNQTETLQKIKKICNASDEDLRDLTYIVGVWDNYICNVYNGLPNPIELVNDLELLKNIEFISLISKP